MFLLATVLGECFFVTFFIEKVGYKQDRDVWKIGVQHTYVGPVVRCSIDRKLTFLLCRQPIRTGPQVIGSLISL